MIRLPYIYTLPFRYSTSTSPNSTRLAPQLYPLSDRSSESICTTAPVLLIIINSYPLSRPTRVHPPLTPTLFVNSSQRTSNRTPHPIPLSPPNHSTSADTLSQLSLPNTLPLLLRSQPITSPQCDPHTSKEASPVITTHTASSIGFFRSPFHPAKQPLLISLALSLTIHSESLSLYLTTFYNIILSHCVLLIIQKVHVNCSQIYVK